jgi:hypothetical protein
MWWCRLDNCMTMKDMVVQREDGMIVLDILVERSNGMTTFIYVVKCWRMIWPCYICWCSLWYDGMIMSGILVKLRKLSTFKSDLNSFMTVAHTAKNICMPESKHISLL